LLGACLALAFLAKLHDQQLRSFVSK